MKENCLSTDCGNCSKKVLREQIIIPFEKGTKGTKKLFLFFLYSAPNIESVHSKRIITSLHTEIFNRMMEDRRFKYKDFCASNASIEKELRKGFLDGNEVCLKCKRFVCKKKQRKKGQEKETDLDCFLRHIRNSIAHGRVYYFHAGNKVHIVFEDENTTGKLSARIVCIRADLEYWKKVLSDDRYY